MFVTKKKHERDMDELAKRVISTIDKEFHTTDQLLDRLIKRAASRRKDASQIAKDLDYHLMKAEAIFLNLDGSGASYESARDAYEYLREGVARAIASVDVE